MTVNSFGKRFLNSGLMMPNVVILVFVLFSGWVVVCSCLVFLALLSMVAVVSIGMAALWAIKPRFYMIAGGLSIFTG